MVVKLRRYLGNTNALTVHDTINENVNCQLDEISFAHRQWYDSLLAAKAEHGYDNCAHCISAFTR